MRIWGSAGRILLAALLIMGVRQLQAAAQATQRTEIVPQLGHTSAVYFVTFSPDGRLGVSAGADNSVLLWDIAARRQMRSFRGHTEAVTTASFSHNSALLVTGSEDRTIKLWEVATGKELQTFKDNTYKGGTLALSADGLRVFYRSGDDSLAIGELATGRVLGRHRGKGPAAFSSDGRLGLAVDSKISGGRWWDELVLVDVTNGKELRRFGATEKDKRVMRVAFSPNSHFVLIGDNRGMIKLYDVVKGEELQRFTGHANMILSLAFSHDGRSALSSSYDKPIKYWNLESGTELRSLNGHTQPVHSVAFSPDGRFALSGGGDRSIRLWDLRDGSSHVFASTANPHTAALSPDGRFALIAMGDGTRKLWDLANGRFVRDFVGAGDRTLTRVVAFSPQGGYAASPTWDGDLLIWQVPSGSARRFHAAGQVVLAIAFSADGRLVATGSRDGSIFVWVVETGELLRTLRRNQSGNGRTEGVQSLALAPDAQSALLLDNSKSSVGIKLIDLSTGAEVRKFKPAFSPAVFSHDGQWVLTAATADHTLKIFEVATGKQVKILKGHTDNITSLEFSRDDRVALSGSWDHTIRLWDVASGRERQILRGHTGWVRSAKFFPNRLFVLSTSDDGSVRVWSTESGKEVATLLAAPDRGWVTITPDGFFSGSSKLEAEWLAVSRGLNVTTLGQVHQSLYNPDLVWEALAGDPSGDVRKAAQVINLEKVLDSGPAPLVTFNSPLDINQSAGDLVTVRAWIEDRGKGIGRIEWRVNGVTAAVSTKPAGNGPQYPLTQDLALDLGDNIIELVAYNGSNLLASLPARTAIKFTGSADRQKPKLHILAIGVNAYIDKGWIERGRIRRGFQPLTLAVKDAESFATEMKRAASSLYEVMPPALVLDKNATRENIEKVVEKMAKDISPRDTFILFAAAHGTTEHGRFYLIPQDYQGGPGALQDRAIGQDQLQHWLANRIKARKALILLDTCESGAVVAGHQRSRTEEAASEAGVGRLHEATGRPVLTAAATGQFALEGLITASGERQGFFTHAILNALRNGDTNSNGTIELSELVAYVQDAVPKLAEHNGGTGRAEAVTPRRQGQSARFGSRGEDFVVVGRLQ